MVDYPKQSLSGPPSFLKCFTALKGTHFNTFIMGIVDIDKFFCLNKDLWKYLSEMFPE